LIRNKVEENISLDYKQCNALSKVDKSKNEISKDVSAFANSIGGTIIYGIKEDGHVPVEIDDGFDPREITKEWIELVIDSKISPRIEGIEIMPIETKETKPGRYVYVVNIPQSTKAPHQASDKKYYKRYNFRSAPMEDYEIRDVANRRTILRPLISVDTFIKHSRLVYLSIKNIGSEIAINVKLKPDRDLRLRGENDTETIPIFSRGIKFFPSNKEFVFLYGTFPEIVKSEKKPLSFKVQVTYNKLSDPITEYSDEFHIDIQDYYYTNSKTSLIEDEIKSIREAITKLADQLSRKMETLSYLEDIADPTGLRLSVSTLRNIKHVLNQEPFEKIDSRYVSDKVFMEILGVDMETAYKIEHWIRFDGKSDPVQKHSLSPEIMDEFKKYFKLPKEGEY
jgi:hypothetical protein